MSAQVGGTVEVYHIGSGGRSINSSNTYCAALSDKEMAALLTRLSGGKWLNRNLTPRQKLFHELAFCRMKLCRARSRRSTYSEHWVAFYRDECERVRRCLDVKSEPKGKVVYPEIRAEVRSWLVPSEMPW